MPFLQLFYISSNTGPVHPSTLVDILSTSRRNNALDGITGILVQGGNRFLQLLEGPAKAVEDTFARIRADPRHRGIVMLGRDWTHERSFPDWAMAYEELDGLGENRLVPIVDALVDKLRNPTLKAELRGFAQIHSAA